MTTSKRNTKSSAVEAVAGDRDLLKALMKEALQEVLEGEMTVFLGAKPGAPTQARNGHQVVLGVLFGGPCMPARKRRLTALPGVTHVPRRRIGFPILAGPAAV